MDTNMPKNLDAAFAFLDQAGKSVAKKADKLLLSGAVELETIKPGFIYFVRVRTDPAHGARIHYSNGVWRAECSCGAPAPCPHSTAGLKLMLGENPQTAAATSGSPPSALLDDFPRWMAYSLKRKLTSPEAEFARRLQDLHRQSTQTGQSPTSWDLLSMGLPGFGFGWDRPVLWGDWPANVVEFWHYIALAANDRGSKIPAYMEGITKLEWIAPKAAAWKRQKAILDWKAAFKDEAKRPFAKTAETPFEFRVRLAPKEVLVEWRESGSDQFSEMKQTHLRRFTDDYHAGRLHVAPEIYPIWSFIHQKWALFRSTVDPNAPEIRGGLNHLIRSPSLREWIINDRGEPFLRHTEPLKWTVKPPGSPDEDYKLHLTKENGTAVPPPFLILTGRPTLYVMPNEIFPGPPPKEGRLAVRAPNLIPAAALESREGVEFLLNLGVALPPHLQTMTRNSVMKVSIEARLASLYTGSPSEALFLKVLGNGEERTDMFTPSGWERLSQPKIRGAGGKNAVYVYDRAALGCLPRIVDELGATWDSLQSEWRLRVTKSFPDKFIAWKEGLPPEVELLVHGDLATLAQEAVLATVKLSCEQAETDWFDLKVVVNVADTELTQAELKLLLDAQGGFVRLGKKGWKRMLFNVSEKEDEQLARLGLSPKDFSSETHRLHALQLANDAVGSFLPEEMTAQIHRRASELKTRVTPPVPEEIVANLRPYQVEGFHFLAYLTSNNFGGILADDMGLGKTLQALTWLGWLKKQPGEESKLPSLVVCPKSVMDNWLSEPIKFFPNFRVALWNGSEPDAIPERLKELDLFVINYSQLRALEDVLPKIRWLAAILDEGQYIKNPESQTARAARALNSKYRLVLSGTPIENRLLDLWSLMTFAMPGVLGKKNHFTKIYNQAEDPYARKRLAARVRPFILRRTKGQVATDLPARTEEDILCEMEGEQKTLYKAEYKRAQQMLLRVQTHRELDEFRFHFLASLLKLRQICCHPALVGSPLGDSAKLDALLELLEPLMEEGHKVLVFSQFVSMLDLIKAELTTRKWPFFYLAGETENRGALVQEFQGSKGGAVFLISLKAGGAGLNLTSASYVVLFDPWWNPAVEAQAIDRTHRIGQTSNVIAYRLIMKETIEQKIRALQKTKAALAQDVLGEENFQKSLTLDDLRFLFSDEQ